VSAVEPAGLHATQCAALGSRTIVLARLLWTKAPRRLENVHELGAQLGDAWL
jgi:hypothetical protein